MVGVMFTIVCTYSGFLLLAVASLWNANILQKIKLLKVLDNFKDLTATSVVGSSLRSSKIGKIKVFRIITVN